jgi:Sugar (pentulose and hexulose) kinases
MVFLGLDIGSTGCKCAAFGINGTPIHVVYREYPVCAGYADIDADDLFCAAAGVIEGCAAMVGRDNIAAIGVTSFGESTVAVDRSGNALSRFIMYTDKRGADQTNRLIEKAGYNRIADITCVKPDAMYSLPKIMWTLDNMPNLRAKVYKFLQVSDFICFRLTGEPTVSATLACRTMAYDIENGRWDASLLDAAGIDESLMPTVVPCGTAVGGVLPLIAARLGLRPGTVVVNASQDQIAASVGAGVLDAGQAVDGTGSVECITPVFSSIIHDPAFAAHNFVCVPHAENGKFATYAFNWAGGVLVKWFRDCFASHMKEEAKARGISVYRMLDEMCPDSTSDIIVIPHHMGAGGTPDTVSTAKGTITGMTMKTGLGDIYRAVLEGLTFEMLYNIEALSAFGIEISTLRATGGGSVSRLWLQIKADILGREITPLASDEAGAAGCAMMAAVAVGEFANLRQASEVFVHTSDTYRPNPAYGDFYREKYEKYKSARAALLKLWE